MVYQAFSKGFTCNVSFNPHRRYWPVSNICQVRSKGKIEDSSLSPFSPHLQHIFHHTRSLASIGVDTLTQTSKLCPPSHSTHSRSLVTYHKVSGYTHQRHRLALGGWTWGKAQLALEACSELFGQGVLGSQVSEVWPRRGRYRNGTACPWGETQPEESQSRVF